MPLRRVPDTQVTQKTLPQNLRRLRCGGGRNRVPVFPSATPQSLTASGLRSSRGRKNLSSACASAPCSRCASSFPRGNLRISSAQCTARRVSDFLPPCRLASSSCECVPVLGAFKPRLATLAGKRGVSHRCRANTRGAGDAILSPLERGQHRICLYVGPQPPHRQMPPRAVPAPVMGRCPKPRGYGKSK